MNAALIIKLQPNQDVVTGLEAACRAAGVRRALILSGVGSVNDAWLAVPGGNGSWVHQQVVGPGLEVAGLTGEVRLTDTGEGASSLTAWATTADGSVVGGVLVRGLNIVCITFEIILQEWADTPGLPTTAGATNPDCG